MRSVQRHWVWAQRMPVPRARIHETCNCANHRRAGIHIAKPIHIIRAEGSKKAQKAVLHILAPAAPHGFSVLPSASSGRIVGMQNTSDM